MIHQKTMLTAVLAALFVAMSTALAMANGFDDGWPREMETSKARVVMYQPQIESLTEIELESRAAVSVTLTGEDEPHFGAVWIKARLDIDRDEREVALADITVTRVRFPDANEEDEQRLARFLEKEIEGWQLTDSLDRLIAALELADHEQPKDVGLKHDPPKIVVENSAATLVLLDGEPRKIPVTTPEKAAKKDIQRVANTPALMYFEPKQAQWYVYAANVGWYRADHFMGPYEIDSRPPKAIRVLTPDSTPSEEATGEPVQPKIVVATEPTELVVIFGEPEYAPLGEDDLMYVTNTDSDIIMDAAERRSYLLVSGRWYASGSSLAGPWTFVASDRLPERFAAIPADSEKGHVRAQIAGTIEAEEAVLDNIIPQTTAIRLNDSSLKVTYDGDPRFEAIEGTDMKYAVNSPQSVVQVGATYYCCEQAVWYESSTPNGPWKVSTAVAEDIYDIPASSPVHNVTYVKVYETTPEVVYVGYTPGYVGSYYSGGCVVYGTGWHYPGWYGHYYYPRPSTWGFHASYNPWTGWGFGVSWTNGPLTISVGGWGHYPPYYSSWWGPWGYRPYYPPYYPGYRPPYYPRPPIYYPPSYRPPVSGTRPPTGGTRPPAGGARPVQLPAGAAARPANNIYSKPANAARNAPKPATRPAGGGAPSTMPSRPNDVFTDRSGNVYRRTDGGWEQRQGGSWNKTPTPSTRPSQPSTRPSQPSTRPSQPSTRPSQPTTRPSAPSSLNRDYGARTRGNTRTQQYRSAPRSSAPRPSTGAVRRR